jgi:hypothetical protein
LPLLPAARQASVGQEESRITEAEEDIMKKKLQGKIIQVEAYSGYKANERPLHFIVDNKRNDVKQVLDQWYSQDHDNFKVLADDGRIYVLKWHRSSDTWFL